MELLNGNIYAKDTHAVLCCTVTPEGRVSVWDTPQAREWGMEDCERSVDLELTIPQLAVILPPWKG